MSTEGLKEGNRGSEPRGEGEGVGAISKCAANKRDGTPCTLPAQPSNRYCWAHAPENAEHRRRTASKAAKSKKDPAITELNQRIREVLDNVLLGEVDRADASVFFQGAGVLIRGIEQARRNRETEEFEHRLQLLEEAAERAANSRKNGRGYGWG